MSFGLFFLARIFLAPCLAQMPVMHFSFGLHHLARLFFINKLFISYITIIDPTQRQTDGHINWKSLNVLASHKIWFDYYAPRLMRWWKSCEALFGQQHLSSCIANDKLIIIQLRKWAGMHVDKLYGVCCNVVRAFSMIADGTFYHAIR